MRVFPTPMSDAQRRTFSLSSLRVVAVRQTYLPATGVLGVETEVEATYRDGFTERVLLPGLLEIDPDGTRAATEWVPGARG